MQKNIEKIENQDDVQDFLRMHAAVQHRVYGFIMSFIGNWNDSDDIYQETTSVMWKKYKEFTPGTDFLSWSLKIAHFQILSHKKKDKVSKKHFNQTTLDNLYEVAISSVDDSGQSVKALRGCMMKLSERSRNLLLLRYEEGITIPKVAQRIQQSVHTLYKEYGKIHTLLFRCIRKEMGWS